MSERKEGAGSTLVATLACFCLAALLLAVGWWLVSGFFAAQESISKYAANAPRVRRGAGGSALLGLLGVIALLGSLAFVGIGFATIYFAAVGKKKQQERADDSWKSFPAPSDAPRGRAGPRPQPKR